MSKIELYPDTEEYSHYIADFKKQIIEKYI